LHNNQVACLCLRS